MALSFEEIRRQMLDEKAREARLRSQPSSSPIASAPSPAAPFPTGSQSPATPSAGGTAPLPSWLLPPLPPGATATPPPSPAPPAQSSPPVSSNVRPPVAAPEPVESSPPMSVPTFTRFFKLGTCAVILLAGSYFAVRSVYPFLMELARPGSVAANSKDAPASIKMLQQTRAVVAKNNANVEHLDRLLDDTVGMQTIERPLAARRPGADFAPLPEAPKLPTPKPKPQVRLERLKGIVLDDLHIAGVVGGKNPRIMIDGLLLGVGDLVDIKRQLRFVSLDESRRIVVLGNGEETIEKSY